MTASTGINADLIAPNRGEVITADLLGGIVENLRRMSQMPRGSTMNITANGAGVFVNAVSPPDEILFWNGAGSIIPPFGICLTDGTHINGAFSIPKTKQPDASGVQNNFLINGPTPVQEGAPGGAQTGKAGIYLAAYDPADGTPAPGDNWGTQSGTYLLKKGAPGFLVVGVYSTADHIAFVVPAAPSSSILAVLVDKDYTSGQYIAYSWIEVTASATTPVTYTKTATLGCKGHTPAYHARNFDLPVQVHLFGVGVSEGCTITTSSGTIDGWSVVRLFKDPNGGDFYIFNDEPHVDLFRRTGTTDSDGEIGYERYWDQENAVWADGREVRIVSTG